MERDEILKKIHALRPWYHNMYLGDGIWTKDLKDPENIFPEMDIPDPLWKAIEDVIPRDLRGTRALDVGCGAGFFSFKLSERGARVMGIDSDQGATVSFIEQAAFCKQVLGLDVEFRRQDLLTMPETDQFDLILFLGVLYHIQNFGEALEKLYRLCKTGGLVAVESQVAPRSLTCYEGKGFRGDPTTYFVPSKRVLTTLLKEHGFQIKREFPVSEERYFCLCARQLRFMAISASLRGRNRLRKLAKPLVPASLWKIILRFREQLLKSTLEKPSLHTALPPEVSAVKNKACAEEPFPFSTSDDSSLARVYQGWRQGYGVAYEAFKAELLKAATHDHNLLALFRHQTPLPPGYGVGVDERCIEYPWLIAHATAQTERWLDAGSSLNHEFIMELPLLNRKELHILTLSPERDCFWSKGVSYIFCDLRDIPIRDNFYDVIVCISTLEHVGFDNTDYTGNPAHGEQRPDDFFLCIREFNRVLKPGGTIFLTVPFGVYRRFRAFQQFDWALLCRAVEAFARAGKPEVVVYRYTVDGWNIASAGDCAECQYVEWVTRPGEEWPEPFPVEPDLAIAARAVACVRLTKR